MNMRYNRHRAIGPITALAVACLAFATGCSGGGTGSNSGSDGGSDLVATDLGQGYVNGATTTIVAPPGYTGADAGSGAGSGPGESDDRGGRDRSGGDRERGALGRDRGGADLSRVTEDSVRDRCPGSSCDIASRDINHPTWGPTRVFSLFDEPAGAGYGAATLVAVDASGEVKWTFNVAEMMNMWELLPEGPDASEALFFAFNPGRWNGVLVLHPSRDGFIGLPDGGTMSSWDTDYVTTIYNASVGEVDADGNHEIISLENDMSGGRGMANATIIEHYLTWTGERYEEQRPPQPMR